MGSNHGIGITRNDYRRRNRKEKPGSSHFYAARNSPPLGVTVTQEIEDFVIPKLPQKELVRLSTVHWKKRERQAADFATEATIETKCFTYIRHELTPYDKLSRRSVKNLDNPEANFLYLCQKVCNAVIEVYPWLRKAATVFYKSKTRLNRRGKIRVIKRPQTLSQEQMDEYNAKEDEKWKGIVAALEQEEQANEDWEVSLTEALSSLASERLLFFPPFLKKEEIERRRFGSGLENNDRWWEWEKELGLKSKIKENI